MAVDWDDRKIYKFIELFEAEHCLWDPSSQEYKNKVTRNSSWENIAKEMSIPKRDLENKMHILRSQFGRERKKYISASCGTTGMDDKSKWKFYEPLKFFASVYTDYRGWMANNGSEQVTKTTNIDEEPANSSESLNITQPLQLDLQDSPPFRPKRKKIDNLSDIVEIVHSTTRLLDTAKDEFDIYGQYVASELRTVTDEIAVLEAKSQINNILIKLRMANMIQGADAARPLTSKGDVGLLLKSETDIVIDEA